MKLTASFPLILLLALSGCHSNSRPDADDQEGISPVASDGPTSRVRIAGESVGVTVIAGRDCIPEKRFFRRRDPASLDGFPGSFFSLKRSFGVGENHSIGMPITPDMPKTFNEFSVPARKPWLLVAGGSLYNNPAPGAQGIVTQCPESYAVFVPEEGKDYDVRLLNARICLAVVSEIVKRPDGTTQLTPVKLDKASQCAADDNDD